MKDHLRFSVAFWHTFAYGGVDMFGDAAFDRPWNKFTDPLDRAYARIDAMLEFTELLGLEFSASTTEILHRKEDTERI